MAYQLLFVVVYTPIYKTQAKESNRPIAENSFSLLVSNVRLENEHKDRFYILVKKHNPDIVLITEPDQAWANSVSTLDEDFPHSVKFPLENTYGMILLSKFPLNES